MASTITTMTFYTLAIVTVVLQLTMYFKRAEFLRTIKKPEGLKTNLKGFVIQDLGTMLQIIFPVKLESTQNGQMNELRKSATKFSTYWIISLLTTLILPILIFKLLEW